MQRQCRIHAHLHLRFAQMTFFPTVFQLLIRGMRTATRINPTTSIVKYRLFVEPYESHKSSMLQIWGIKEFLKAILIENNVIERFR